MAINILAEIVSRDGKVLSSPMRVFTWRKTKRLSKIGGYQVTLALANLRYIEAWHKRIINVYYMSSGSPRRLLGTGIIDAKNINISIGKPQFIEISGPDLLAELSYKLIYGTSLGALSLVSGVGWQLAVSRQPPTVNGDFFGETAFASLVSLSEMSGENFRLGINRTIQWIGKQYVHCGLRALKNVGLNQDPKTCLILDLKKESDSSDLITRLYPYGSGGVDSRLSILNSTEEHAGYHINRELNYIEKATTVNEYGLIESEQRFNEVSIDEQSEQDAANQLLRAAVAHYEKFSQVYESYDLNLAGVNINVNAGELIRVVYRQVFNNTLILNINRDFYILEVTEEIDNQGRFKTSLKVANMPRWPVTESSFVINKLRQRL